MAQREPTKSERVLLTPAEMTLADRASIAAGVPGTALMQAAGQAVAQAVQQRWSLRPVLVLCGPGNNGGDGFVAARHLQAAGWPVRLALLGSQAALTGDAAAHAALWTGAVEPMSPQLLGDAAIVIDALFGAGLSRAVEGVALAMIEAMAAGPAEICAVDVPSGLDGETGAVRDAAAPAALTVTFLRKKPGHVLLPGRALCGELVVADIGTPDAVLQDIAATAMTWENASPLWRAAYPWPRADGHKYQRGHALVLGGAALTGASRLTARAALRVGAGLVTLVVPQAAWAVYAVAMTSVMVHALRDGHAADDWRALLQDPRCNAIAIGPGAGVGEGTRLAVLGALATRRAVVLDADALTSFADAPASLFAAIQGPCVLTPHEGEFARLFSSPPGAPRDKLARARRAAAASGAVVLLKGSDTVIAEPGGRAVVNTNAPASLATGGSGDVLAGFITGLMAQGLDAFPAACSATWLHGEVAAAFGPGLVADDLPEGLPAVLRRLKDAGLPDGTKATV